MAIWARNQCSAPLFDPFIGLVELENRWETSHEVILLGFQLQGTFLEVDVEIQRVKKSWIDLAIWTRNQCSAPLFYPFIGLVELENRLQQFHEVILLGFQLLGTFLEVDVGSLKSQHLLPNRCLGVEIPTISPHGMVAIYFPIPLVL